MAQIEVNPPAAAAFEPLSIVSACSKPGSRRCTCMSRNPGATTRPVASNVTAPVACRSGPTRTISPPLISTSAASSRPDAGSITRPFLMSSFGMGTQYAFEHRHPDRDAVLHLVQNDRALRIRHLRRNLASAVDGTGVHHDGVRLDQVQVLQPQPVELEVLARRERGLVLPL